MAIQWSLVLFSLLAGTSGSLFAMVGVAEIQGKAKPVRMLAPAIALVMMLLGGVCAVTHLAQPANIMAAAANVFSFSGISVELILAGITTILLVAYLVMGGRAGDSACKIVAVIGGLCGIALGFATGNGYVFGAQPYWNTIVLPLAYLASDLAIGASLMLLLMNLKGESGDTKPLALVALVLAALQAVLFLAYGATTGFVLDAMWYWLGAVAVGGVGTLVFAALAWKGSTNAGFPAAALACAAIGGIALRCAMWLVGTGILHLLENAAEFAVL